MQTGCAFIFARGGSKGLPKKNILSIAGLPMFVHGVQLAKKITRVSAVYVSTDCDEIASLASCHGARVIKRPPELASDSAPEWLAWKHAIKSVRSSQQNFDFFLSLPPTSPLRHLEDVERCIDALKQDTDIVITMSPSYRNPWFNMVMRQSDQSVRRIIQDKIVSQRQAAPTCYDVTTVAYVAKPSYVLEASSIWDGKVDGIEIPIERSLDIDTEFDFKIAKFLMEDSNREPLSKVI